MILRRLLLILLPLAAIGCGGIPKDPENTLERIRAERTFSVGIIGSGGMPVGLDRQEALLQGLVAATGARPGVQAGASEPLLARLEAGELDLVMGSLAPQSPWAKRVTIIPPLAEEVTAEGHVHVVAIARNGENAWIALLYREAGKVAAAP